VLYNQSLLTHSLTHSLAYLVTYVGIPASSAGGESGVVGAVPWAYYAHSVLQGGIAEGGGCEAPPNVPLFEDLTVGDRI